MANINFSKRRVNKKRVFIAIAIVAVVVALIIVCIKFSGKKESNEVKKITLEEVKTDSSAYKQWNISQVDAKKLEILYNTDTIKKAKNDTAVLKKIEKKSSLGATQYVLNFETPITDAELIKDKNIVELSLTKVDVEACEDYGVVEPQSIASFEVKQVKKNATITLKLTYDDLICSMQLSEDRTQLTLNVLQNVVYAVSIGVDKEQDYIQLTSIKELNIHSFVEQNEGRVVLAMPYTVNSQDLDFEELSDKIKMVKKEIVDNILYITLSTNREYAPQIIKNGTTTRVELVEKGEVANMSTTSYGKITLKKVSGLSLSQVTEDSDVINRKLTLTLSGKFDTNTIKNGITYIDKYSYELNMNGTAEAEVLQQISNKEFAKEAEVREEGNNTVITLYFDDTFEFLYSENDENILIKPVRPRDKYDKIVVFDPGHGGQSSPGAVYSNVLEKDINLNLYRFMKEITDAQDDIKIYYTRNADVDLSLEERVKITERINPDFFVSLHNNANDVRSVKGTEVFYGDQAINNSVSGYDIANVMYNTIYDELGTKGRGAVKTESYYVVIRNVVPAVLVELQYMTNSEDMARLKSDTFLKSAATTLLHGIEDVFETYDFR